MGLSDHSATIYPGLAGVAMGMDILEVHVALSREMFGPDVIASVTTAELRQLVDGIRFIERMRANPLDKDASARETDPLRRLFTKSVVARRPLARGTVLSSDDLAIKKPGTGLSPDRLPDLVGKRLARAVVEDQLLVAEDIEAYRRISHWPRGTESRGASSQVAERAEGPRCARDGSIASRIDRPPAVAPPLRSCGAQLALPLPLRSLCSLR